VACAGPLENGKPPEVKVFGTYSGHLRSLVAWLREKGVESVAMESTGVYWVPPHRFLREAGFAVMLVNSRETKAVKGRPKTDKQDCMWICRLRSYGLLRGSFVPDGPVADLRGLWRCRGKVVAESSRAIQRMNKAMLAMNCRLDIAVSDISGGAGCGSSTPSWPGSATRSGWPPWPPWATGASRKARRKSPAPSTATSPRPSCGRWRSGAPITCSTRNGSGALNDKILELLTRFPDRSGGKEPPAAKTNYKEDSLGFPEPLRPLLFKSSAST